MADFAVVTAGVVAACAARMPCFAGSVVSVATVEAVEAAADAAAAFWSDEPPEDA